MSVIILKLVLRVAKQARVRAERHSRHQSPKISSRNRQLATRRRQASVPALQVQVHRRQCKARLVLGSTCLTTASSLAALTLKRFCKVWASLSPHSRRAASRATKPSHARTLPARPSFHITEHW